MIDATRGDLDIACGRIGAAPSTVWSDHVFTIRKGDVRFVDRLLERGLVTRSEHARLAVLIVESRLVVRVLVSAATIGRPPRTALCARRSST